MIKSCSSQADVPLSIRDWELQRCDTPEYCCVEIRGVMRIYSEEGYEECLQLLRAIVNTFINIRICRDGMQAHYRRERRLWINYYKQQPWEWRCELEDLAHLYYRYEGRPLHAAQVVFYDTPLRFDSKLRSSQL